MKSKHPLYRKVNTQTLGVRHGEAGGKAKWERNTKKAKRNEASHGSMHGTHRHGFDYTPLFRFLLAKVGENWDDIHREAIARLDREEPIFWMVALHEQDRQTFVRLGENSYFSGLFVDEDNRLARIDPDLTVDDMVPSCGCCTHTFNGERFTQPFA